MKRNRSIGSLIFQFLLASAIVSAQPPQIHDQIQQVYSFQPHLLTDQQIEQKSRILDEFWKKAKAQSAIYVPSLRQELANFGNPSFFLYDGSMLLLSLSDKKEDRKVVLSAIAHCDIGDVQANDYFKQVHRLAAMDEDVTLAAFHILDSPKFKVFIPQHALTLGQDYALVYLLLPTDEQYWMNAALQRLGTEQDLTAQKSLLLLLWYAQRDAADKAIGAFATDTVRPAASRNYARDLMKRKDSVGARQRAEALLSTEASIRQKRQERLKSVSDEALIDLDNYTMLLLAKGR
jgi:hypothetical protein